MRHRRRPRREYRRAEHRRRRVREVRQALMGEEEAPQNRGHGAIWQILDSKLQTAYHTLGAELAIAMHASYSTVSISINGFVEVVDAISV